MDLSDQIIESNALASFDKEGAGGESGPFPFFFSPFSRIKGGDGAGFERGDP